ncbi:MAG: YciI family protein [Brevundimonas sp.]
MPTFAVTYTYDERNDVRDIFRAEHREYMALLEEQGTLLFSGPYVDGAPGALLGFRADDEAALAQALAADPFAREGLIASTDIRSWLVVRGPWAQS